MDGNRTHPGRVISAPQTVLKTAGLTSTDVHCCPPTFERRPLKSAYIRHRPLSSIGLAVILAVIPLQTCGFGQRMSPVRDCPESLGLHTIHSPYVTRYQAASNQEDAREAQLERTRSRHLRSSGHRKRGRRIRHQDQHRSHLNLAGVGSRERYGERFAIAVTVDPEGRLRCRSVRWGCVGQHLTLLTR